MTLHLLSPEHWPSCIAMPQLKHTHNPFDLSRKSESSFHFDGMPISLGCHTLLHGVAHVHRATARLPPGKT